MYTGCFLPITLIWWKLLIIGVTHILIDHYQVASIWARLVNNEWEAEQPVIPRWCMTVIDQTMHLTIDAIVIAL
jgi:hypothetical protein